jgi:hypothetical protein
MMSGKDLNKIILGYIMAPQHRLWRVANVVRQYKRGKIQPHSVDFYIWPPHPVKSGYSAGHVAYRYSIENTPLAKIDEVIADFPTLDIYRSHLPDTKRVLARENSAKMTMPLAINETEKAYLPKSIVGFETLPLTQQTVDQQIDKAQDSIKSSNKKESEFFDENGLKDREKYVAEITDPDTRKIVKKKYDEIYPSGHSRPLGLTEYEYVTPYVRDFLKFNNKAEKIITIPYGIDIELLFMAAQRQLGRLFLSNETGGAELVPSYFSLTGFQKGINKYWVNRMHCTNSVSYNLAYALSRHFPVPLFEEIEEIWDVHSFSAIIQQLVDDMEKVEGNWHKYEMHLDQGLTAYLDIRPYIKEYNGLYYSKIRLEQAIDKNCVPVKEYTQDGTYLGESATKTEPFKRGEKKEYSEKLASINELLSELTPRLKFLEEKFPKISD